MITIKEKIVKNDSHDSSDERASWYLLLDKKCWIVELTISILISTLNAGWPKRGEKKSVKME